jgi:preprotein translocase subunit SecY
VARIVRHHDARAGLDSDGMGYQFYFGGTVLLILVGVAMDTVAQIEAQLVMRNYEGFLGSGEDCADAEPEH